MRFIKLSDGKAAKVDDADYRLLIQWKWSARKSDNTFYAYRSTSIKGKTVCIRMHRFLLGVTDRNIQVDHIDRNGLNNQRENLRLATGSENNANRISKKGSTSTFLGVSRVPNSVKWRAKIAKNRISFHIGTFDSEIEAAIAYNKKAIEVHGVFANLNKIPTF